MEKYLYHTATVAGGSALSKGGGNPLYGPTRCGAHGVTERHHHTKPARVRNIGGVSHVDFSTGDQDLFHVLVKLGLVWSLGALSAAGRIWEPGSPRRDADAALPEMQGGQRLLKENLPWLHKTNSDFRKPDGSQKLKAQRTALRAAAVVGFVPAQSA